MASTTRPTLLLVLGAWFLPNVFDKLIITLKTKYAYDDIVVASYPSIGPPNDEDASLADCATDTLHVRKEYLSKLIEAGKDVVIFAHSYGGMPAAGAATGLTKRTRSKEGKRGGVIGLIMASAFVIGEGISCAGGMGGDTPPWVLKDNPSKNLCWPQDPHAIFAADVPKDIAEESLSKIVPQATIAFFSSQPKPVFSEPSFKGQFAYIRQTEDQAVPVQGQDAMMQYSGVEWIVRDLPFSHNAGFITGTEEMAKMIVELVSVFEANL